MRELNTLRDQFVELNKKKERLSAERDELKADNDDLRKVVYDIKDHVKDTELKMLYLIKDDNKLEEDYDRILKEGHPTEALK